jgi:hypothetical protein
VASSPLLFGQHAYFPPGLFNYREIDHPFAFGAHLHLEHIVFPFFLGRTTGSIEQSTDAVARRWRLPV